MIMERRSRRIGVLLSGGLDSSILVAQLLETGCSVQPLYIRSDLVWQHEELAGIGKFLAAIETRQLDPLVVLDLPLADVYGEHWSVTGDGTPDGHSTDEAVYLPGRNALLIVKALLWCQLNQITELALATLGSSPFPDATRQFFVEFESVLRRGSRGEAVQIEQPFAGMNKQQVMQLGRQYPLELTFSCIAPVDHRHCGRCNKCAERREAFLLDGRADQTDYVATAHMLDVIQRQ